MENKEKATLLLDLDDTLLRNNMDYFLPAYFQAIKDNLSVAFESGEFMPAFMEASQRMLGNTQIDQTLAEVFYAHFLSRTGLDPAGLEPEVDRFYREVYPQLAPLTGPVAGAAEAVRSLIAAGHPLVVATNPLFPKPATRQRIDWAGLPVDWRAFEMVTTFEHFHFAKPQPAYYAEILAYLGWPDGPIVVAGNGPVYDIQAARSLGLATYFVNPAAGEEENRANRRHGAGPIGDFPAWLDQHTAAELLPDFRSPDGVLAVLKSTPAAIHSLLSVTDPDAWGQNEPGAWSATETVAHLRDVEIGVNLPRAKAILAETNPHITGVDTDSWHSQGFGQLPPVGTLFSEFTAARQQTLEQLEALAPADWNRPARHTIFGPTDLLELTHIMSGHDRTHMRQIRARFGGRVIWQ